MAQLKCKDLTLGYEGKAIISKLSFEVNAGDYLCIVGENGSGKSTLIKSLLHLKTPMSGHIEFGEGLKKNEIGYLPQQTVIQKDFPASVMEVVLSGCLNRMGLRPFYNKTEKQIALDNMERLGISRLSKECYRELSGGQQQRTLLSRALCATQKFLLLDEPVAGLDPIATEELYASIEELSNSGITIIMVSHDISMAVKYATHILHIGAKIFFGLKEDYLKSDVGHIYAKSDSSDAYSIPKDVQGGANNG